MSMQPWRLDTREKDDDEIHHGRNIKRIRELLGWKQEALAAALGIGWSQKRVSIIEGKARINHIDLQKIATILGISEDLLRTGSKSKLRKLLQTEEARPPVIREEQIIATVIQHLRTLYECLNDTTAVIRDSTHLFYRSPDDPVATNREGNRQTDSMPM
ncbi:helix-turn-helix domain-containing protein [Dawidia soli]|uniref:Helix-turn-helix domain-containing protein n=1 Tax=Dawidia soli TaxID=2782352 RepID=A0AAP2DDR7_9BACT|nr:helix-turn-helix transcriptional regulator [Dawidia soli]MBT1688870.1 helix-turn-helix domain-containing protein [Dawidia soli]